MTNLLSGCSQFDVSWFGILDRPGEKPPPSDLKLSQLKLGTRAMSCLRYHDRWSGSINTINDLLSSTAVELLERRNLGMKTLETIRARLATYGLKLEGE